ncbi:hydrogenase nickel incorporation protein HypB [bacterium]|nr:hydrogenase nickel incorporation protein HypB [bacterium]
MLKEIKVYRDLMGANEEWAQKTRDVLKEKNITMVNIIGSPGAGKTALLEKTHALLATDTRFAVLEGDVETTRDAERLAPLNIPVSQLLTDGACHLEAKLVHYALLDLPLNDLDMVIVENVGNLVCPAEFDIGEKAKIAVLSVTEGEDKALKYPLLFREAEAVVVSKTDLLPHIPFNLEACLAAIKQINAQTSIFTLSSLTGDGLEAWVQWLKSIR